jgi:hypothetical protein
MTPEQPADDVEALRAALTAAQGEIERLTKDVHDFGGTLRTERELLHKQIDLREAAERRAEGYKADLLRALDALRVPMFHGDTKYACRACGAIRSQPGADIHEPGCLLAALPTDTEKKGETGQ